MDRLKKLRHFAGRLALLILCAPAQGGTSIGVITQVHGEPTFFPARGPAPAPLVLKKKASFMTGGSYLNDEATYFTARLLQNNWLRLNPNSKLDAELDEGNGELTVNLYSGSLKGLFAVGADGDNVKKVVIKAGDARIETTQGKLSVVRNRVFDDTGIFVEKGSVVFSSSREDNRNVVYVHAGEMARLVDRTKTISPPRKMSAKELKFLKDSNYLKGLK